MTAEPAAPIDDGAARHLPGSRVPEITLNSSDGGRVALDRLSGRSTLFIYPSIGGPGDESLLDEWTALPGARGCTPEACDFRDQLDSFEARGVAIFGLSVQASDVQAQHVESLQLSYPLLSDPELQLADALQLPTFSFRGRRYYERLTLITLDGAIEAALYPVFPPDRAASQALVHLGQDLGGSDTTLGPE